MDWQIRAVEVAGAAVAVWMVVDAVPRWIELPALVVLWPMAVIHFLAPGLPILIRPFYHLWEALWPGKADRHKRPAGSDAIEAESAPAEGDPGYVWKGQRPLHVVAGVALFLAGHPVLAFLFLGTQACVFLYNTVSWIRFARRRRN